ncbi:hypothetical protein GUJ93_ZPchr0014g47128 [Zizania palustris]|uniref:Myb/SANT-like domain-containing protein n=1 Tax=Zizania palustris TaxID=103762 RepID=A0A8J5W0C6_ZIZPA|nr:hypothetical protein GUJ93_ZPchr0014g47128 [Zizania palustris]
MAFVSHKISNHVRTWKRKYVGMNKLKNLSAALWNEDNYIISLEHEHYTSYIKDHKNDAEFLNKPIEHYGEMATIFGNSVAIGKFTKGSNEPLGMEVDESGVGDVEGTPPPGDNNGISHGSHRTKRTKTTDSEESSLIEAFQDIGERLAIAIENSGKADNELPPDLFDTLNNLP